MKPFDRLPASVVALAAVFLLGVGLTRAQDDARARTAAAENLLTAMHTEQALDGNLTRMLTLVDRFGQSVARRGATLTPDQTAAIEKAESDARDTIRQELGYATLKGNFIQAYADAFSEGELKDLIAFYQSPIGQRLVEKQPALNEKVGQAINQKARTVSSSVIQKLSEAAQKNIPPAPTPATVTTDPVSAGPETPAAPAAPAVPVPTPAAPPMSPVPGAR